MSTKYYTKAQLMERGWSEGIIKRLNLKPDLMRHNPKYVHPLHLYEKSTIKAIENTDRFANLLVEKERYSRITKEYQQRNHGAFEELLDTLDLIPSEPSFSTVIWNGQSVCHEDCHDDVTRVVWMFGVILAENIPWGVLRDSKFSLTVSPLSSYWRLLRDRIYDQIKAMHPNIDNEIYEWHSECMYDSYTEFQDLFGIRLDLVPRDLYS